MIWDDWQNATPGTISLTINLDMVTDSNVTSGGGGGGEFRFEGVIPSATFFAEVTYDYEAVPEPSAFAGLFGLVALLAARRRA